MSSDYRLILYHKHPSSGRTLFLRLNDRVCQFEGLSNSSSIVENDGGGNPADADLIDLLAATEQRLGVLSSTLKINREFNVLIDDGGTPIQIYLIQFATTDPPQEELANQSGKFIALTEARRLPPIELELLRLAYSTIMDN